jgi:hypothetical protein
LLRRVTWRSWAGLGLVLAAYVGLGFWFGSNGNVEALIYKWGLLAASVAPFALIAVYTASRNKWWSNDLGTALVQTALCMIPIAAPLAYVFWVDGGMLTSSLLAWVEVSGPVLSTLAMLRLCWVFARIHRDGNDAPRDDGDG